MKKNADSREEHKFRGTASLFGWRLRDTRYFQNVKAMLMKEIG